VVHFTADAEFRDLLERARALTSHRLPNGDLATLMKLALKAFVHDAEKQRFAVGRKVRRGPTEAPCRTSQQQSPPPGESGSAPCSNDTSAPPPGANSPEQDLGRVNGAKRSRHVAAAVVREVYLRDRGQCSFVSEGGRRCGERALLELDHVTPFAVGGASTPDNLRLLCRAHNRQHARNYFGQAYVDAAVDHKHRHTAATEPRE
jgi:hypothetical protein